MAQPDLEHLARNLDDFRLRPEALRLLREAGPAAVPLLAEKALGGFEGARWAAVKLLGEIGDEAARPALERLRADPALAQAADEALRRLGPVAAPAAGPAAEPAAADPAALLAEIARRRGWDHHRVKDDLHGLTIPLPSGRRQKVQVLGGRRDELGRPLVTLYSICAPDDPAFRERALRLNAEQPGAALALAVVEGQASFVLVEYLYTGSLTAPALEHALMGLAHRGDALEKRLTGQDVH